jgi:hypothetical protein
MKKKPLKAIYSMGIPHCNNESPCTIEFQNDELVLTILHGVENRQITFNEIFKSLIQTPDYSKTIRINRKDILGLEIGESKTDKSSAIGGATLGLLTFGVIGAVLGAATTDIKNQPLILSIKYNAFPIQIRFNPDIFMRQIYQEILSFWHS